MQCSPNTQSLGTKRWQMIEDEIESINDDNMSAIKNGMIGWTWFNSLNVDWAVLLHSLR